MFYPLEIRSAYDFSLRATAILTNGYKSATVLGIGDYSTIKSIQDVIPIHDAVYPQLPVGTLQNAKDLIYVKIKTSTGEIRVIAMDWIASAPTLVTSLSANFLIHDIGVGGIATISEILRQNGFTNFTATAVV